MRGLPKLTVFFGPVLMVTLIAEGLNPRSWLGERIPCEKLSCPLPNSSSHLGSPERLHFNNRVTSIHVDDSAFHLVNCLEGKQGSSH